MSERPPALAVTDGDEVVVRGHRLAQELIGRRTFTEMFLLDLDGALPSPGKVATVDAILVALMEHGLTPSTLAARLVHDGAPEGLQGPVAAGLLAVGSRFLGTVEDVARLLQRLVVEDADEEALRRTVREVRAAGGRVPGLGHNLHAAADARVASLVGVASEHGVASAHVAALFDLARVAGAELERPLIVNAAGAVGAIVSDLGYPPPVARGLAVVARAAGLVAHVVDEMASPTGRRLWTELHHGAPG